VREYAPESEFLHQLFESLNMAGIHYAVMRNYEPLPYSAGGSDLDVLVATADHRIAKETLIAVVDSIHGKIVGIVATWNFFEASVIGFSRGQWWGICVEFYREIAFKSAAPLVNYSALVSRLEYCRYP